MCANAHCRFPAYSGRTPSQRAEQLRLDLVADLVRCLGYVQHTRGVAERVGCSGGVQAELSDIEERLSALHLVVALIAGGWCPRCGGVLTDPKRSPTGTRHCRTCRIGWALAESEHQARAVDRPWPEDSQARELQGLPQPDRPLHDDLIGDVGHDRAVRRPPRRPGLGLGGRVDFRRLQAQLQEAIAADLDAADIAAPPAGRRCQSPAPAPSRSDKSLADGRLQSGR